MLRPECEASRKAGHEGQLLSSRVCRIFKKPNKIAARLCWAVLVRTVPCWMTDHIIGDRFDGGFSSGSQLSTVTQRLAYLRVRGGSTRWNFILWTSVERADPAPNRLCLREGKRPPPPPDNEAYVGLGVSLDCENSNGSIDGPNTSGFW